SRWPGAGQRVPALGVLALSGVTPDELGNVDVGSGWRVFCGAGVVAPVGESLLLGGHALAHAAALEHSGQRTRGGYRLGHAARPVRPGPVLRHRVPVLRLRLLLDDMAAAFVPARPGRRRVAAR